MGADRRGQGIRLRPRARDYAAAGLPRPRRPDRPASPAAAARWIADCSDPTTGAELRRRLVDVIANATGPDRQCHLNIRLIAARARADFDVTRYQLRTLIRAGTITRFPLPNGNVATMLLSVAHD